jgi:hypothetical protein
MAQTIAGGKNRFSAVFVLRHNALRAQEPCPCHDQTLSIVILLFLVFSRLRVFALDLWFYGSWSKYSAILANFSPFHLNTVFWLKTGPEGSWYPASVFSLASNSSG